MLIVRIDIYLVLSCQQTPYTIVSRLRSQTLYFWRWLQTQDYSWKILSVVLLIQQAGEATAFPGYKQKVRNMLKVGHPQMSTCRSWYLGDKVNLLSLIVSNSRSQMKVLLTTPVWGLTALCQFLVVVQKRIKTLGWNSHISMMAASIELNLQGQYKLFSFTLFQKQWLLPPTISWKRTLNSYLCLLWHQAYWEWALILRTQQEGFHTSLNPSNSTAGLGDLLSLYIYKGQEQQVSLSLWSSWSPFQCTQRSLVSQKQLRQHWQPKSQMQLCLIMRCVLARRSKMTMFPSSGLSTMAVSRVGMQRESAKSLKSYWQTSLECLSQWKRLSSPVPLSPRITTESSKAGEKR